MTDLEMKQEVHGRTPDGTRALVVGKKCIDKLTPLVAETDLQCCIAAHNRRYAVRDYHFWDVQEATP